MNPQSCYKQPCSGQAYGRGISGSAKPGPYRPGAIGVGCPALTCPSSGGTCAGAARGVRISQSVQNIGRSLPNRQYRMGHSNFQQAEGAPCCKPAPPRHQLTASSPSYCTPQAVTVNISADQLVNAKKTPKFPERGEPCDQNGNMKYIQLNWKDLLGGMDNLRVTMSPSCDSDTPPPELKVSFGYRRTDPPHAAENYLKVLSTQPAQTAGRMDLGDGDAYAGYMRVCTPSNLRLPPVPTRGYNPYAGGSHGHPVPSKAFCRQ